MQKASKLKKLDLLSVNQNKQSEKKIIPFITAFNPYIPPIQFIPKNINRK